MLINMHVRCRQCYPCRQHRAHEWYARSRAEVLFAPRTWFGTLTFRPGEHALAALRAADDCAKAGLDFDEFDDEQRFKALDRAMAPIVTRFFKRVRKQGAKFRYLVVAEAHEEKLRGLPHYHLLVHELPGEQPVKKALLRAQWQAGFSRWRLLRSGGEAGYLTKYITKAATVRVRASEKYGESPYARNAGDAPSGQAAAATQRSVTKPTNNPDGNVQDQPRIEMSS